MRHLLSAFQRWEFAQLGSTKEAMCAFQYRSGRRSLKLTSATSQRASKQESNVRTQVMLSAIHCNSAMQL